MHKGRKPNSSQETSTGAGLPQEQDHQLEKDRRGSQELHMSGLKPYTVTTAGHSRSRSPTNPGSKEQHLTQKKRPLQPVKEPHKIQTPTGDKTPPKLMLKN